MAGVDPAIYWGIVLDEKGGARPAMTYFTCRASTIVGDDNKNAEMTTKTEGWHHSSSSGTDLVCLTRARCVFVCSRRRLEAAVGRVAIRGIGGSAARSISSIR